MIDVTTLDKDMIDEFGNLYSIAKIHFKCIPEKAKDKKQLRMRNWLEKQIDIFRIRKTSEEITDILSSAESDAEFWDILKECRVYSYQLENTQVEAAYTATIETIKEFPDDVKDVFGSLTEAESMFELYEYLRDIEFKHGSVYLNSEPRGSCAKSLVLKGVSTELTDFSQLLCDKIEMRKSDGKYCLDLYYYEEGDEIGKSKTKIVPILFDNAEVEEEFYRVEMYYSLHSPWDFLGSLAEDICYRAENPNFEPNESEKELLPLLSEIASITYFYEEAKGIALPILKEKFKEYRYDELIPIAIKIESKTKNKYIYAEKLRAKLNELKYADLWREIYYKIKASQESYPSLAEEKVAGIDYMRKAVQKRMESHGYSGTYPDFYKEDKLHGVHLEKSYGMTYFVGPEKRVVYRVSFFEMSVDEQLYLIAVSGTALLKKNERADDIFECCFNANGRRIFHSGSAYFRYDPVYHEFSEVETGYKTEQFVDAAVKRAELKKLTKKEKQCCQKYTSDFIPIFPFAMFAGLFFGIAMMLAFSMILLIFSIISGEIQLFIQTITSAWWYLLFAGGGLLFGGALGIAEHFANRK